LCDFLLVWLATKRANAGQEFLIRATSQHPLFERLGVDPEKLDEMLIEPHRDVIVVLNLARVPQTNLVNEPPQVGYSTEKSFGTSRVIRH
jgi:hypothetical protein